MTKFLTAVSALALGLAMSSAALADDATANGPGADNAVQLNDNYNQDNDQTNGNALLSNNDNNGNDSSNNSNQDNNTGNALLSGNTVDSNNDNSAGNNRNNNQSQNLAVLGNNLNSNNDNSVDLDVDVDNSVSIEDTAIGIQSLDANVSDVGVSQGSIGLLALSSNGVDTGDSTVRGNAFSGLTGIATVSQNNGVASASQAATAINANASLNFD